MAENNTSKKIKIRIENPCMGVPITYLDKHNPEQFEIVAFRKGSDGKDLVFTREREYSRTSEFSSEDLLSPGADGWHINGKRLYARIFIRRKTENQNKNTESDNGRSCNFSR